MSKRLLKRSFDKITYKFTDKPDIEIDGPFGVYIHVPFCKSFCNFCPFYKELYNFNQCSNYVDALISEIKKSPIEGKAKWVYFGGGTPNILTPHQLTEILDALKTKIDVKDISIEVLPDILNADYIKELKIAGFSKVSIGVESLDKKVIGRTGRSALGKDGIGEFVEQVKYRGMELKLNFLIGLPGQTRKVFLDDIRIAAEFDPYKVTISPSMQNLNIPAEIKIPEREQFKIIEEAGQLLNKAGYKRVGLWTFSKVGGSYDSSGETLVGNYVGFGPGAFSSYGQWRIANPELKQYLDNFNNKNDLVFVAPKNEERENWRKFAMKLYNLDFTQSPEFVKEQKKVFNILKKSGSITKEGQLTENGIMFGHEFIKTLMELIPNPLQNPSQIEKGEEVAKPEKEQGIGLLE